MDLVKTGEFLICSQGGLSFLFSEKIDAKYCHHKLPTSFVMAYTYEKGALDGPCAICHLEQDDSDDFVRLVGKALILADEDEPPMKRGKQEIVPTESYTGVEALVHVILAMDDPRDALRVVYQVSDILIYSSMEMWRKHRLMRGMLTVFERYIATNDDYRTRKGGLLPDEEFVDRLPYVDTKFTNESFAKRAYTMASEYYLFIAHLPEDFWFEDKVSLAREFDWPKELLSLDTPFKGMGPREIKEAFILRVMFVYVDHFVKTRNPWRLYYFRRAMPLSFFSDGKLYTFAGNALFERFSNHVVDFLNASPDVNKILDIRDFQFLFFILGNPEQRFEELKKYFGTIDMGMNLLGHDIDKYLTENRGKINPHPVLENHFYLAPIMVVADLLDVETMTFIFNLNRGWMLINIPPSVSIPFWNAFVYASPRDPSASESIAFLLYSSPIGLRYSHNGYSEFFSQGVLIALNAEKPVDWVKVFQPRMDIYLKNAWVSSPLIPTIDEVKEVVWATDEIARTHNMWTHPNQAVANSRAQLRRLIYAFFNRLKKVERDRPK